MSPRERVLSIDLLRGIDVMLMLFVNEVAGVRGAPRFLQHMPSAADGMTVTDLVFPAFLFITGMAIPFALGGRLDRGESRRIVWQHVLSRTAALLVIGVLMVNAELAHGSGPVPLPLWNVLMTLGVMMVWQTPGGIADRFLTPLRMGGAALLVVLAFFFRSGDPDGIVQLRPHWWGILGLIGWAYFVAAATYLLAGDRPAVYVGAVGLLYCVYLAHEAGQVRAFVALEPFVNVGRMLGSHAALAVSGTLLGLLLVRERRDDGFPRRVFWRALGLAAAFGCTCLLLHSLNHLHPAFFINKVRATAPWCLASAALTTLAWLLLFLLADVKRWRRWPSTLFVAGENALVAYLLAPFVLSVFELLTPALGGENPYARLGAHVMPGLIRSAIFALAIVWLTGALKRAGVRMHL